MSKQVLQWLNSFRRTAQIDVDILFEDEFVILDTETTGVGNNARIVQISIIDSRGTTLFSSLINPEIPIEPAAAKVHGITEDVLTTAPTWVDVYELLCMYLAERNIVIYNAMFDTRVLLNTCAAYGLDYPKMGKVVDAMEIAAKFIGAYDPQRQNFRWIKLAALPSLIPNLQLDEAHDATFDCKLVLSFLNFVRVAEIKDEI